MKKTQQITTTLKKGEDLKYKDKLKNGEDLNIAEDLNNETT